MECPDEVQKVRTSKSDPGCFKIAKLRAQGLGWKKISGELELALVLCSESPTKAGKVVRKTPLRAPLQLIESIQPEFAFFGVRETKVQTSRTPVRKTRIDSAGGGGCRRSFSLKG
jgi:hypothetical protein